MRCGKERENEWHLQRQIVENLLKVQLWNAWFCLFPNLQLEEKLANSLAFQVHLFIGGRWKCTYSDRSDTCDGSPALLTAWYGTDHV